MPAPDRSLKGCTVHWDSDPGFVPLLPALAFDEYLPNVRLIGVSTDAGEGVIVGEHAQQVRLGEFEAWIADADSHLGRDGVLPLYELVPFVDEHNPPGNLAAQTDFTVRINGKKERLWGEATQTPDGVSDVVFSLIPGVLWDWAQRSPHRPLRTPCSSIGCAARPPTIVRTASRPTSNCGRLGAHRSPFGAKHRASHSGSTSAATSSPTRASPPRTTVASLLIAVRREVARRGAGKSPLWV